MTIIYIQFLSPFSSVSVFSMFLYSSWRLLHLALISPFHFLPFFWMTSLPSKLTLFYPNSWFPPLRVPSPSICFIISFPDEPHPGLCFDILTRFRNFHSLPITSCHFNTRNDLVFFLKLFLPCAHACSSSSLLTIGQLFLYFT